MLKVINISIQSLFQLPAFRTELELYYELYGHTPGRI